MSQESSKGCLPHGWVVKTSSKFPDRVYYFNTNTGNSTWECPELLSRSNAKESSAKKGPVYKVTSKSSLDSQTNIVWGHSSRSSHTPIESPSPITSSHVDVLKNISTKRQLEIDTPTTSRNTHSSGEFSFHKPSTVGRDVKERKLATSDPCIPKAISKSVKIPTAVVTPVIAGEETSTDAHNSTLSKTQRRRNRKKAKSKEGGFVPRAVALPSAVQRSQKIPKDEPKRLRTSPPLRYGLDQNNPSLNASTSTETVSADSDMELEFGSSLNAIDSSIELNDNSSWVEVEMFDVSEDLSTLDEIVPARDPNQLESYYIVLDTNILIHDIVHIEEIKETPLQGCGPPHIIIPWVVFQELDRLKSYNDIPGKLAQKAVRYLFKILKSKHPRFHGQSGEEAHKLKREYHDSNDDKLIDLCLSLRKKMSPEKVILMTNDKNLANKAMTYDVIVHDWTSLLKDIKPDTLIEAKASKKKEKKPKKKSNNEMVPALMSKERQKLVNERSGYEKDITSLVAEARQLLKNALDPFLVQEMQKCYGPAWEFHQIDRRLLREILAAYLKFWPTVFYHLFPVKVKSCFELLHQKAISPEGFDGTIEDCVTVLHAIEDIFRAIVKVQPDMSSLISSIQSLQENYSHIFSKYNEVHSSLCDVENAIKEKEASLVLETLNHNWTVINEICGMVMDFYGIQHDFRYPKPETLPHETEYRRVVSDLYPSLLQLKQIMKKVIEHVIESTPSQATFKKFVAALKNLIPSLNIQSVTPNMSQLGSKTMEQFCRNLENRPKLLCGYQQLEHFCDKLNEAIQAMMALKKNQTSTTQV